MKTNSIKTPSATILLLLILGSISTCIQAQTNVTFHGLVDAYVGTLKYSGGAGRVTTVGNGGMTASWIGLSGREKINDTLTATFDLDSFFRVNTGQVSRARPADTFFSRQAAVGLQGRWGTLKLGRNRAPNFFPLLLSNPFGSSTTSSPLYRHAHTPTLGNFGPSWIAGINGDAGWSNSVLYQTPDLAGFTGYVLWQFSPATEDSSKNNVGGNIIYRKGAVMASAFIQKVKLDNPTGLPLQGALTEETAWFGSFSYDFKWMKIYGSHQQARRNTPLKDKTWQIGANTPVGAGQFLVSWARTHRNTGSNTLLRNTVTAAYDYFLSRRSDVYVLAMNDKAADFHSANSLMVGIRHRF